MEELDSLFAYDRIKEALERLESAPFEQNLLCVKLRHNTMVARFLLGELSGPELLQELQLIDRTCRKASARMDSLRSDASTESSLPEDPELHALLTFTSDDPELIAIQQRRETAEIVASIQHVADSAPLAILDHARTLELDPTHAIFNAAVVLAQLGFRSAALAVLRYLNEDRNVMRPAMALDAALLYADLQMRGSDVAGALTTIAGLDFSLSALAHGPRARDLYSTATAGSLAPSGALSLEEATLALHLAAAQAFTALGDTERSQELLLLAHDAESELRSCPHLPGRRRPWLTGLGTRAAHLGAKMLATMGQEETARDQLNNIATNPPGSLCIEALHNSAKLDQGADRLTFAALKLTKALQAAYAASSLSPDGAPARVAALTALPELCCSAGLPRLALGDAALAAKCFESAREAEQRDPLLLMRIAEARLKMASTSDMHVDAPDAHVAAALDALTTALARTDEILRDPEPGSPEVTSGWEVTPGLTGTHWAPVIRRARAIERGQLQLLQLQLLTRIAHTHLRRGDAVSSLFVSRRIVAHLEAHEAAWALQEVAYAALRFEWDLNCSFAMLQVWEAAREASGDRGAGTAAVAQYAARALQYLQRLGGRAPVGLRRAVEAAVALESASAESEVQGGGRPR